MESLEQPPLVPPRQSAYLVALDAGFSYREYRVEGTGVTIGRDADHCDIVVAGTTVSRRHVRIRADDAGSFRLEDLDSTNGVFVNGTKLLGSIDLEDGDLISLGSGSETHLRFQSRSSRDTRQLTLAAQDRWVIGRAPDCDLPLPYEPTVSSHHAVLTHDRGILRITDQHSLNGTWVNGRALRESSLAATDIVVIGSTHFRFHLEDGGTLTVYQRDCGQAVQLECVGLTRTTASGRSARVLLDDITLTFAPGEFVGILGPSGAGKTTLLSALGGFIRPSGGQVLFNETPLDSALAMFRNTIGYVPQDDILHPELSVETSLDYIARLRLSPDIDATQRANIVGGTIETLGLNQVRHCPIHQLSGGQRKRVSIGAELLVRPSILFLDEPTSGLDPSVEERLMRHFRSMAHSGTTVVITTHVLYNLALLDKVVILSQGKLVFCGTPEEALRFFSEDGTPLIRPTGIFDLLTGEEERSAPDSVRLAASAQEKIAARFAHRYLHSAFHVEHIDRQLSPVARKLLAQEEACPGQTLPESSARPRAGMRGLLAGSWLTTTLPATGALRSWRILSRRHLHIRCSSARRLLWFLFIPLALALVTLSQHMHGVLADEVVNNQKKTIQEAVARGGGYMESQLKVLLSPAGVYDPRSAAELLYGLHHEGVANLPVPMSVLLMIVMTAVFSGTLIACLEISTEQSIYRRERMSHLQILPYLGSKLPFCWLMTALQCLVFLGICWLHPAMRQIGFVPVWLTMVAIAWGSVAIGLFLSTVDPTQGRFSVLLAVAVVLPQLILSGGLGPDFYGHMQEWLRWATDLLPARRGLEMLCTALFNSLTNESTRWIPGFIHKVIGFDFGGSVYYTGGCILMAQSLLWLFFSACFLKYRDIR